MNDENKRPLGTRWCAVGSWIAGLGLLLAVVGLAGARAGLLAPIAAFSAFSIGVLLCVPALLVLALGLLLSRGSGGALAAGRAWGAFAAAAIVFGASWLSFQQTRVEGAPPIHDISTDLEDPPRFDEIVPRRAADGAANPPEYPGETFADQQREAFPDLVTLERAEAPDEVFAAAADVARELGWEVVAADPASGQIEATATTGWFRFRDDVVIRVSADDDGGSEVDVRSKSRVGQGDMGANAARIRRFIAALEARLG